MNLRVRIAERPPIPHHGIGALALKSSNEILRLAEAIITSGWRGHSEYLPSITPPINWNGGSRSLRYYIHAWEPIEALLQAHSLSGATQLISAALPFALDWMERFQKRHLDGDQDKQIDEALRSDDPFIWYDMGVGQRVCRLAYLVDAVARLREVGDEIFDLLFRSLVFHMAVLRRDAFFTDHNNHGLYQAFGQLSAARRFACLQVFSTDLVQGQERVNQMLKNSFFASGPHKEHSPGYHRMILDTIRRAQTSGLLDFDDTDNVIDAAEETLAWMVKPDGYLATIGDTDPIPVAVPTKSGVRGHVEAGYAFVQIDGSYLAQIAGFHSRVHKHADHLSFVWHDRGHDILIDPGRYGYVGRTEVRSDLWNEGFWYSDPKRIYVERTRAHNAVEIDGRDYRRKGCRPFGSALLFAGEHNNLALTCCDVRHFQNVRHIRTLILSPGHFLLVLDWLKDGRNSPHDFRQWFQLARAWEATAENGVLRARHPSGLALSILSALPGPDLAPVARGQMEPEMSGWTSDKPYSLVPSPSVNFMVRQSATVRFATLLSLGETVTIDRSRTVLNGTLSKGRIAWTEGERVRLLEFQRERGGRVWARVTGLS